MELGKQIKLAREAAGLSQTELANRVGVSKQAVFWWEEGIHSPKQNRYRQMEDVLNVNFDLSERGFARPRDSAGKSLSVDPEIMSLAIAIGRLPRAQRDAITTLAYIGEEKALGTSTQQQKLPSDTVFVEPPAGASGEFNVIEKGEGNASVSNELGETESKPAPRRRSKKAA